MEEMKTQYAYGNFIDQQSKTQLAKPNQVHLSSNI